jgi:MoaA/NifB/PqqE/SkfB family radical SAM enzyme
MFKFTELQQVHLEITSKCQASCPMCARNDHGGKENPNLLVNELSLDDFILIFNPELLKQLSNIYFCGNFGDPILSKDLIKMIEYAVDTNPEIRMAIHTNGSARTKAWWRELAKALPKNHMVHFALDGLENTHHLYRVGTDFNKIIENAKEFISAGGIAEWAFLSFKHNEHQIDEAKALAKKLGFQSFNHKATGRFVHEPVFSVQDKDSNFLYNLEPPKENKIVFIDKDKIKNYKKYIESAEIRCRVLEDKSVYIDAQGHFYPCCFLGSAKYLYAPVDDITFNYHEDQKKTLEDFISFLGGWEAINLKTRSVKEIIESLEWQSAWDIYWHSKKLTTCSRVCGVWEEKIISQYGDQFINLEKFNEQ